MPRYEVRFCITTKNELDDEQLAAFRDTIRDRNTQRGMVPKPDDAKVYVTRIWQEHEKRELLKAHIQADREKGIDWNDFRKGCACLSCCDYRDHGVTVAGDGITIPLRGRMIHR